MSKSTNNNEYESYIEKKHAEMQTPVENIDDYVRKATHQGISNIKRLMRGEANEVYDITLNQGQQIIVRISHNRYGSFGKEGWAMEQCKKNGIPVPNVLMIEDDETKEKFRSICILEKLKGQPLLKRVEDKTISPEDLNLILKNVGTLLSQIHSIPTRKFGWLNEHGESIFATWDQYVLRRSEKIDRYKEVIQKISLEPSLVDKAFALLIKNREHYSSVKPVLLHGDLGYEHIFVDGTTITGIIDWGNTLSGDPAHDFAWWNFFHDSDNTGTILLDGYQIAKKTATDFQIRQMLCQLYLSLDFLDYYDQGNFKRGVNISASNLQKALDYFDKNG